MYVPRHGNTQSVRSRMLAFAVADPQSGHDLSVIRILTIGGNRYSHRRSIRDRSLLYVPTVCLTFISLEPCGSRGRRKYSPLERDLIELSISDAFKDTL